MATMLKFVRDKPGFHAFSCLLFAVLTAGCVSDTGSDPRPSRSACRDVFVDEIVLDTKNNAYFKVSFDVSSRTSSQIRGTLHVQRFEITSWGDRPRIRGHAPVVLNVKPTNESKVVAAGTGIIGAFSGISNRDGSFTDFMWRSPVDTFEIDRVYVKEAEITFVDIRANFFTYRGTALISLKRSC
ncbi:hypothetical protein [Nitratireductor sp. ZSWI3]|uniref:hypothetical protein n=1 Tax=Nitratireductor sp. ZSWI3 TaxID=2966359 RepID=UPI0021500FF2|nr:hypothetical protein [Nitratireductor sp. ZSWI3]MCR4265607.1 hypothetical protein [Nitratireductor sp. ZSWI3]